MIDHTPPFYRKFTGYLSAGLSAAGTLAGRGVTGLGQAGSGIAQRTKKVFTEYCPPAVRQYGTALKEVGRCTLGLRPVNFFGTRVGRVSDTEEPLRRLQAAEQELLGFARNQPTDEQGTIPPPRIPAPTLNRGPLNDSSPPRVDLASLPATTASEPLNLPLIQNRQEETDQQLRNLSDNLSHFIPLYAMVALGNIDDCGLEEIVSMVQEATLPDPSGVKPAVKALFMQRYGARLSAWQKCKIGVFNLFVSSSIFSKTVDAYMQKFLKEMRMRLSAGRWTEQPRHTERLIDDLLHFFNVYKCATFAYAGAAEPTGTLKQYREEAMEKMFGKTLTKTCKECSSTLVDHVSPYVEYFEGNWWLPNWGNQVLNRGIRMIVKLFLPKGLKTVILQTNAATKPYHLPFVKALTDTVTEQLQKLQEQLDLSVDKPLATPSPPVPGTTHLKEVITSLFYVLEFAHSNTQEAIQQKRQELKAREEHPEIINGKIEQGIQDAVLNGIHVLLHHLAEEKNSEEMLKNFFALANAPFSQGKIVTQAALDESKANLYRVMRNVGSALAKEAVKEESKTMRPNVAASRADNAFKAHQGDARIMVQALEDIAHAMTQKIGQLKSGWTPERDILRDLDSMHKVLKAFSNKEQIASDLQGLSNADQKSILNPLTPLYDNIAAQTHKLRHLQEQQQLHKAHFQLTQEWQKIDTRLAAMPTASPPEGALEHLPFLKDALAGISKYLPPSSTEVVVMTQKIQEIQSALEQANIQKQALDRLRLLDHNILQLIAAEHSPNLRKSCLTEIRSILQQLPKKDREQLFPHLQAVANNISLQKAQFEPALNNLGAALQKILSQYATARTTSIGTIPSIHELRGWVQRKKDAYQTYQIKNGEEIAAAWVPLAGDIKRCGELVEQVMREKQLQLSPRHLGIIGGASLGVLSLFSPLSAVALGAIAYTGINQVGPLLKGGPDRSKALGKIGLQTSFGVGAAAAVSTLPFGPPLVAVSALLVGGAAGQSAIPGIIDGGQEKVEQEITRFFDKAYEFAALSGALYQPVAKIAMKQIIDAYAP